MIVEIDGDCYHTETPAAADRRLKFLREQGVRIERIPASACNMPQKATQAVNLIIRTIDKLRGAAGR